MYFPCTFRGPFLALHPPLVDVYTPRNCSSYFRGVELFSLSTLTFGVPVRLAVGAVRSGFDPFQPEPEHALQVWFTLWHEPAPEPLGSGSPGLVRQVRVHGTEFR